MLTSLYSNNETAVHRVKPVVKIFCLFCGCSLLFLWDNWVLLIAMLVAILSLYILAKIPGDYIVRSISPAIWFLVAIFSIQLYMMNLELATFIVVRFVTMIMAASLVTMTTKSSDMIEGIETAMCFIPNESLRQKISLSLSLCLRFIPRVRGTFLEVKDAQRARGLSNDWRALATPTIVRTLKSADEISQAIEARSSCLTFNQINTDKMNERE